MMKYRQIAQKVLTLRTQALALVSLAEDLLEGIQEQVAQEEKASEAKTPPKTFGSKTNTEQEA